MSLKKFTTEELKAEIARRQKGDLPLKDFYFLEEDDDDRLTFIIVHRRRWHLEHCSDDGVFDSYIDERIPDGFCAIQESIFEYKPAHLRKKGETPTRREAKSLLQTAGAKEMKWGKNDVLYVVVEVGKVKHYITVNIDDKKTSKEFINLEQGSKSLDDYLYKLKYVANFNKLHMEVISSYENRHSVAIISQKIWNKLPEFPQEEE